MCHRYSRTQAVSPARLPISLTAMHAKISLTFTALLFLTAKGSMDDPGPQTFAVSTSQPPLTSPPLTASPPPQFEMKEVIVYLTPNQIRALQIGQGVIEPIYESESKPEQEQPNPELLQIPQPQNDYNNDEEFKKEFERQKAYLETQPNIVEAIIQIQKQKTNNPKPVTEPSSQEQTQEDPAQFSWYPKEGNNYFTPIIGKPEEEKHGPSSSERPETVKYNASSNKRPEITNYFSTLSEKQEISHPNSYNYLSFYNKKKSNNIDIKIFHPAPRDKLSDELDAQINPLLIKKYKLVPYQYLNKKQPDFEQIQEQHTHIIQKNTERQLGALFTPAQPEEQSQSPKNEQENSNKKEQNFDEEKMKYATRYNDQKQAIELQNLFMKQNAKAQTEAIAKAPPIEVHREVSITKHKPIHIINHVQVPVPQPYLVRVPEPFEVKVPQPYPVPFEIIRPVPVEIMKTEKIEVKKPNPYEVEKHVPVPVEKKVYVKVDKPYFVQKVVPAEARKEIPVKIPIHKPQKLTILRHIWEHN